MRPEICSGRQFPGARAYDPEAPSRSAPSGPKYGGGLGNEIRVSCGQLRSDAVLMGESAGDLFPVDSAVGADNLCHQAIFVDDATYAVVPPNPEMTQVCDASWQ